jgi:hypothetical protein
MNIQVFSILSALTSTASLLAPYIYKNKMWFNNKQKRKSTRKITCLNSQTNHFKTKLLSCDEIKEDKMDETFNTHEEDYILWSESLKGI